MNHERREAAARCPRCSSFFCRECVSEHDDQLICARCLKQLLREPTVSRRRATVLLNLASAAAGLLVAWLIFYSFGHALLSIDTRVHDGMIWKAHDSP